MVCIFLTNSFIRSKVKYLAMEQKYWLIFWNLNISNIKITEDELIDFVIFDFIFYFFIFLNHLNDQNMWWIAKLEIFEFFHTENFQHFLN